MDKQTFYTQLSEKLSELGVSDEYIARHLRQFDSIFSEINDEEIEEKIAQLGSIEHVAARIKRMTDKMISNDEQKKENGDKDINVSSEEPLSNNQPSEDREKIANTEKFACDITNNQMSNTISGLKKVDNNEKPPVNTEPEADFMEESFLNPEIENVDSQISSLSPPPDEETERKNTIKFWLIFALTLPISLSLVFAIVFVFATAFFSIAMLIIVAVALLVAITAVATVTSVFGLIFGVAQALSCLPIGLYECGLSVIIGSLAMFVGILVYNFAVRLMPYAAKWLKIFAKYVYKKLKALYIYLKKECIGI